MPAVLLPCRPVPGHARPSAVHPRCRQAERERSRAQDAGLPRPRCRRRNRPLCLRLAGGRGARGEPEQGGEAGAGDAHEESRAARAEAQACPGEPAGAWGGAAGRPPGVRPALRRAGGGLRLPACRRPARLPGAGARGHTLPASAAATRSVWLRSSPPPRAFGAGLGAATPLSPCHEGAQPSSGCRGRWGAGSRAPRLPGRWCTALGVAPAAAMTRWMWGRRAEPPRQLPRLLPHRQCPTTPQHGARGAAGRGAGARRGACRLPCRQRGAAGWWRGVRGALGRPGAGGGLALPSRGVSWCQLASHGGVPPLGWPVLVPPGIRRSEEEQRFLLMPEPRGEGGLVSVSPLSP